QEREMLEARLKRETTELFGEPRLDASAISEELTKGAAKGGPPIPSVTAFDLLDEISRLSPASDKIKLDVADLDIKPKKTFIQATTASAQQANDLVEALKKVECFEDVQQGKLSSVMGPPPPPSSDGKPGERAELKQFKLTINTTCP